jgi:hypothetical protein
VSEPGIADAFRIAYKRGHLTLQHQGRDFECAGCGLTGSVAADGKPSGQVFLRDCGIPAGVSFTYGASKC